MSRITQHIALVVVLLASVTLLLRLPSLHPAVLAYLALVAFWGMTVTSDRWEGYFSLLKLAVLALAVHVVIRTPRHLLLLLGAYALAGFVTLVLNWSDIAELRYAMDRPDARGDHVRFDGTFSNANRAGVFAAAASVCGLVTFFNTRSRFRWIVLASGVGGGLLIGGLSGSRTGIISLMLVGFLVPLMAVAGRSGSMMLKWAKVSILVVISFAVIGVVIVQLPQFQRVMRLREGVVADGSTQARWAMAQAAIEVWKAYPIAGAGFGGYRLVSEFPGRAAHTAYGEVLADGGLIGFTLFMTWYLLPVIHMLQIVRRCKSGELRQLVVGLLAFWMVFAFMSTFSHLHRSKDLIPIWAGICGTIQHLRSHIFRPVMAPSGRQTRALQRTAGKAEPVLTTQQE